MANCWLAAAAARLNPAGFVSFVGRRSWKLTSSMPNKSVPVSAHEFPGPRQGQAHSTLVGHVQPRCLHIAPAACRRSTEGLEQTCDQKIAFHGPRRSEERRVGKEC